MATHPFTYFLHDQNDSEEREETINDQLPAGVEVDPELLGRPFYEVTLECEYDDETGKVKILSARPQR